MTDTKNRMTHAEFLATLTERFGEDVTAWAFVCPTCGDVATVADFRAALEADPRERDGKPTTASDHIGQVCIGRLTGALSLPQKEWDAKVKAGRARGCDWCAFGLFGGPLIVEMPDGKEVASFHIATARESATEHAPALAEVVVA